MRDLRIRDLVDLAESEVDDPEAKIQKVFEWAIDRYSHLTRWIIGFSGSLLIALLVGIFKDEVAFGSWQFWSILSGVAALGIWGIFRLAYADKLSHQYLKALVVLGRLRRIKGFLSEYRRRKG